MSTGNIVQIIGTVVDIEFPRENIPRVYEALTLKGGKLVFEVQQQLGDGVVRTIAMGSSEGLKSPSSRKHRSTDNRSCWRKNTGENFGCVGKPSG